MIRMFLTGLEHRGNDATGIAMQKTNGEIFVLKQDVGAWSFCAGDEYKDFIEEHLDDDIIQVLLHTRAATKGSPRENKNNHPMYAGKSAVIHNGVIGNDDELFRTLDLERKADTDSDILRAIIDRDGITDKTIQHLNKLRGSIALAAIHPEQPGRMLLGRSGSPLTFGSTPDFFAFASEKNVIHRAMRPWIERFKCWFQVQSLDMAFSPCADNTVHIWDNAGQEHHDELKTMYGTYREPIRRVYNGWKDRQADWDRSAKGKSNILNLPSPQPRIVEAMESNLFINCPHCKKPLALGKDQLTVNLSLLCCPKKFGGCGKTLEGARVN